jgi:hypothetical protein
MRFSNVHHAVLTELTHETRCGSKVSHWNCGVRFGTRCHVQPQIQRAVQGRTQLATERASQGGIRCGTRRAIDYRVEGGVDVQTHSGAEFPSLGAIGRRIKPRTRRATDRRAKSLNDGHIDGRSVLGVEPRGHSGSDSPLAGACAGLGLGPQASGSAAAPARLGVLALGFCLMTIDSRVRRAPRFSSVVRTSQTADRDPSSSAFICGCYSLYCSFGFCILPFDL